MTQGGAQIQALFNREPKSADSKWGATDPRLAPKLRPKPVWGLYRFGRE